MREQLSQNRLTYSAMGGKCYGFTNPCDDMEHLQLVADKLGTLEDIEEELGIELIVLFKAIHNGVWAKNSEQGIHFISLILWNCEVSKINNKLVPYYSFYVWDGNEEDADEMIYHLEDYGKTWALTKEELICKKD